MVVKLHIFMTKCVLTPTVQHFTKHYGMFQISIHDTSKYTQDSSNVEHLVIVGHEFWLSKFVDELKPKEGGNYTSEYAIEEIYYTRCSWRSWYNPRVLMYSCGVMFNILFATLLCASRGLLMFVSFLMYFDFYFLVLSLMVAVLWHFSDVIGCCLCHVVYLRWVAVFSAVCIALPVDL